MKGLWKLLAGWLIGPDRVFAKPDQSPDSPDSYVQVKVVRSVPSHVQRIWISANAWRQVTDHLRDQGRRGQEGYAVLAGTVSRDGTAYATSALLTGHQGGHWTATYGQPSVAELAAIGRQLHQAGMVLLAQVHSHPGAAFHSATDNGGAASTRRGFLSIVVPNFGMNTFDDFNGCKVYEYQGNGRWREWRPAEMRNRLSVVP